MKKLILAVIAATLIAVGVYSVIKEINTNATQETAAETKTAEKK